MYNCVNLTVNARFFNLTPRPPLHNERGRMHRVNGSPLLRRGVRGEVERRKILKLTLLHPGMPPLKGGYIPGPHPPAPSPQRCAGRGGVIAWKSTCSGGPLPGCLSCEF